MKKGAFLVYILIGFGIMGFIAFRNFSSFSDSVASEDFSSYVETEAVIREIVRSDNMIVRKRRSTLPAKIEFTTVKGKKVETVAMIMVIPFYGALSKEGDTITVQYNPEKPLAVRTFSDRVNEYGGFGLFALAGLAIVICGFIAVVRILRIKRS